MLKTQIVFKLLKDKFIVALVLAIFNFKLFIVLKINAFNFVIRACFS